MITRTLSALAIVLLVTSLAHAGVYRWVDDSGQVHFGDQPAGDAERLEVSEPTIVPATPVPPPKPAGGEEAAATAPDWAIAIKQPGAEATVRDNRGRLTVVISVRPGLEQGQSVRLFLDGKATAGSPYQATHIELTGLNRGAHTLKTALVGGDGALLARSAPVTFYLHQASRLSPGHQPNN